MQEGDDVSMEVELLAKSQAHPVCSSAAQLESTLVAVGWLERAPCCAAFGVHLLPLSSIHGHLV